MIITLDDRRWVHRWCRHLLRHLNDPAALSENELVAPLFRGEGKEPRQSLCAVRALLRGAASNILDSERGGAIDDSSLRHHAILTRCDLEGQPHKSVASALGLSMRQFYRDRRAMIAWLSDYLTRRLSSSKNVVASTIDVSSLELARARALQYGGYSSLALVLLRSIAESGVEPATVIAAGCQYVSILLEHNDFAQCREQLDVLDRYLHEKALDEPCTLEAQRVALERRNLHAFSGNDLLARRLDERERVHIMHFAHSQHQASREFALNALTFAARRLFTSGRFVEAKRDLDAARDVLSTLREHAPADLEVSFLILYGATLATQRESSASGSRALHDAVTLAARHGASELAVLAAIGLSIDYQMRGDASMALKGAREAFPLAEKVASPLNYAHLCLCIAELEIEVGDAVSAVATLRDAQADLMEGTYSWTYLMLLRARSNLAVRDFAAAKESAQRAIAAAAAQENERVEGLALRALAESYIGLNARSAAVQAIEDAIAKLGRCGYPHALAAAYRIAAKITGRTKYARAADGIEQTLESA